MTAGCHLGFDITQNSTIRSANPENPTLSTNVTYRQTDGQTTCDRKTALCTVVHRVVKTKFLGLLFVENHMISVFFCWRYTTTWL